MHRRLSLFFVAAAAGFSGACAPEEAIAPSDLTVREAPAAAFPKKVVRKQRATLAAIGDVLIHRSVYEDAETSAGYDFYPMFEPVASFLQQPDLTIANSESIIGGASIGVSTYPSFNSPFELGDAMKKAGIDAVSLANNHTLDRGVAAIEHALDHWQSLGITTAGAYLSAEDRDTVSLIERSGITFSFLSYTYATNGIPTPAGRPYLVNRIERDQIKEDLARAKLQSDIAVISLHFGNEYESMPSAEQIGLAQFAAEHGADIILGHHPHVLQPPQWIQTSDGRTSFVFYSLGNFLSGQEGVERQIGGIVHLDIKRTETVDGATVAIAPSFTPTFTNNNVANDFQVVLLKNINDKWNKETKQHLQTWMPELEFLE